MDQASLNKRCVELMNHPRVVKQLWNVRMFWDMGRVLSKQVDEQCKPKVDLRELEVMLSAAAMEPSQCAADLNAANPGRADFIARAIRTGQRPLLAPAA